MENSQIFSSKTSPFSFSNTSSSTEKMVKSEGGAVKSLDASSAAASATTSLGSAPISTSLFSAPSKSLFSFDAAGASASVTTSNGSVPISTSLFACPSTSVFSSYTSSAATSATTSFGSAPISTSLFSAPSTSLFSFASATTSNGSVPISTSVFSFSSTSVFSSYTASAAASATTSNGSAPISTSLFSAPSTFNKQNTTSRPSIFSATSNKQNTASRPSIFSASTPPFGIASSSPAMFSSIFESPFSSPLPTVETTQTPNVAEYPEPLLPEKIAVVNFVKTEHLENVNESEQQKTKKDYPLSFQINASVPNDEAKTEEKLEVDSNSASNSPLPLTLIHISRILKGIPQSSHFLHLRKYSELAQEKLVAAWDQIFEDVVEQVQALKTKDFWVMASELWKTMGDLQGMGYNVLPIRRRLVEMTEVMTELKQSKFKIVELRNKAENHRMERSRLESVILNLQARAEREGAYMEQVLNEVDKMEKQLPGYDALVANLAMKPFSVHI